MLPNAEASRPLGVSFAAHSSLKRSVTSRFFLVVVLSTLTSCGTDPEPLDLSGMWNGAVGGITVTLDLTHDLSSALLSGTWTVKSGEITFNGTTDGRVTGGKSVSMALHHPDRSSLFRYAGQVVPDGTSMRGNFWDADGDERRLDLNKG